MVATTVDVLVPAAAVADYEEKEDDCKQNAAGAVGHGIERKEQEDEPNVSQHGLLLWK